VFALLGLAVPAATADDGVTTFTLTSFDGVTLTGTTGKVSFPASFTVATRFQRASLNSYPIDPCRTFAATYNVVAPGREGFASSIASMTSDSCHARVSVDGAQSGFSSPSPRERRQTRAAAQVAARRQPNRQGAARPQGRRRRAHRPAAPPPPPLTQT
jgi:hypothetical protein